MLRNISLSISKTEEKFKLLAFTEDGWSEKKDLKILKNNTFLNFLIIIKLFTVIQKFIHFLEY